MTAKEWIVLLFVWGYLAVKFFGSQELKDSFDKMAGPALGLLLALWIIQGGVREIYRGYKQHGPGYIYDTESGDADRATESQVKFDKYSIGVGLLLVGGGIIFWVYPKDPKSLSG